ncbi:hypothetical protein Leryth_000031 [Lithospermum erythrorhizon]|nr:hypothetical protein Leryth_000031 [Lithospermum erythrorhizon]
MLFCEEDGYTPEYIYGNYFEWVKGKEVKKKAKIENDDDDDEKEEDEMIGNLGLKDLIESRESNGGRILHRNVNAGSPRF